MIRKAWKALDWALREGLDNSSIHIHYFDNSELSAYDLYGCRTSCHGLDCGQPMKAHLAIWVDYENVENRNYPIQKADEILIKQETIILIYYI